MPHGTGLGERAACTAVSNAHRTSPSQEFQNLLHAALQSPQDRSARHHDDRRVSLSACPHCTESESQCKLRISGMCQRSFIHNK